MVIKDPNSLFKDDDGFYRGIYTFYDSDLLEMLQGWLTKYPDCKINNLEVTPALDKYRDPNKERRQKAKFTEEEQFWTIYTMSGVVLDVSIPAKYFDDSFKAPFNYYDYKGEDY